jgi:hypothetical protein
MCEDTREAQCTIPTFALIKAWDRKDDARWSNEIVVPQFVYLPTSMYSYPWAHKKLPGGGLALHEPLPCRALLGARTGLHAGSERQQPHQRKREQQHLPHGLC